jgi:acetyl-CoA C-acetyltransferase
MKSVMLGATAIAAGDRNIIVAGGFESMSKAPHYLFLRKPAGYGNV